MAYDLTISPRVAQTFWGKVDVRGPGECWPWLGKFRRGYGRFKVRDVPRNACHIALVLSGQPRPEAPNDFALHGDCSLKSCCNPAHLRWGTHTENMEDRRRLGRVMQCGLKGAAAGRAKLTEEQVLAIRASAETHAKLAQIYGVGRTTIRHVRDRVSWTHI